MRTKSHILDRSEKILLKLPEERQLMLEHELLFLEVQIDVRDQLTFIKCALQALNKHLANLKGGGG